MKKFYGGFDVTDYGYDITSVVVPRHTKKMSNLKKIWYLSFVTPKHMVHKPQFLNCVFVHH